MCVCICESARVLSVCVYVSVAAILTITFMRVFVRAKLRRSLCLIFAHAHVEAEYCK